MSKWAFIDRYLQPLAKAINSDVAFLLPVPDEKTGEITTVNIGYKNDRVVRVAIEFDNLKTIVTKVIENVQEVIKIDKVINARILNQIQRYLKGIDWENEDFKGKLLINYLKGVEDALFEEGIILTFNRKINQESSVTPPDYYVLVERYVDYTDSYSKTEHLMMIYPNNIEYLKTNEVKK